MCVETVVEAEEVCGWCEVVCGEEIEGDRDEWFSAASDRFYFFEVGGVLASPLVCMHGTSLPPPQAYNSATKEFTDPPHHARAASRKGKVCCMKAVVPAPSDGCYVAQGKGKGKGRKGKAVLEEEPTPTTTGGDKKVEQCRPLRCLDVFAGCGGEIHSGLPLVAYSTSRSCLCVV